jgi:hypothetical protein
LERPTASIAPFTSNGFADASMQLSKLPGDPIYLQRKPQQSPRRSDQLHEKGEYSSSQDGQPKQFEAQRSMDERVPEN